MSGIFGVIDFRQEPPSERIAWVDARLYYRDELLTALGIAPETELDDEGLILAAWDKWGERCTEQLFGDFAFAIWDPAERSLFCARDRYGLRAFYYHHVPGELFVLASDARAIFGVPEAPYAINEGRIADFLVPELEWIDYTSTFYEGVYRLPPGHRASVDAAGMRVSEYHVPAPGPELGLTSDEEYCEAFIDVFSRAVDERLEGPGGAVGSMLSGGMDSGSIVAIARDRVHPYSLARRRGIACDESHRLYATLDHVGIAGSLVIADDPESLAEDVSSDLAEPFDGQFLFLKAIYGCARRDGRQVVLDGAAGDVIFNESGYVVRMLRNGGLRQAWREIVGQQAIWEDLSVARELLKSLTGAFTPKILKQLLRTPRQRRNERGYVSSSLISAEFAEHVYIEKRFDQMRETFSDLQSDDPGLERVRKIRPNLTAGRERYGRLATSAGIEARDPFTDQRVVDFCSRLPDNQLARNGWDKFLLRNAMAHRLPDAVRWGRGKPHIGHVYNATFLDREKSVGRLSLDRLLGRLSGYVSESALREAWQDFEHCGNAQSVHTAYILALWLDQSVNRPIVKNQSFS